jgi:hypothetical protein
MALANSKSVLAKLLAQENIVVEHRNTSTAYFDPKNRVLVLPIWKDMSNDLYDLLVGHEVGHAWETPAEGWHNAVSDKQKPGLKSYLNVIEDVRIEQKIKNRYPGLRPCFYKAYNELHENNFFGVADMDINTLKFIDRINLHFKIGAFLMVQFTEEEKSIIDEIEKLSTWEQVVDMANRLYSKQIEENEEARKGKLVIKDIDSLDSGEDSDDDIFEFDDEDFDANEDPESLTDSEFRNREEQLISDTIKPYRYATIPDFKVEDFIVSWKELYKDNFEFEDFENQIQIYMEGMPNAGSYNKKALHNEYKASNAKFIQYLVKEFELKRNAAQFARAKVAKTGELDIDKVFSYKYNNDLFKRVTQIPGGKNHGMVMFIDWSGSMQDCLYQTIEQTLVLADFCRRVNIPFKVLAFTNTDQRLLDGSNQYTNIVPKDKFKYVVGDLHLGHFNTDFKMHELISNDMNLQQYNLAQQRLLLIGKVAVNIYGRHIPYSFRLAGTPLNQALVFANKYIPQFKEAYKLDIVNTVILTDGEADDVEKVVVDITTTEYTKSMYLNDKYGIGYKRESNTVITDRSTGKTGHAKPGQPLTTALLNLLKENTGTNLIGYYILSSSGKRRIESFINTNGVKNKDLVNVTNELRKNKFSSITEQGYDKYFLVTALDLVITNKDLKVDSESTKKDVLKAFMTKQKSKLVNRMLLNKFIEEIA